jgi:hypothetical protein
MYVTALVTAGGVAVALLVVCFFLEWLNRWWARRRVADLVRRAKEGRLKDVDIEDSKHGTIYADSQGVSLDRDGQDVVSVLWSQILEICAYKRDLFTVDLICIGLGFQDRGHHVVLELHEEMLGFKEFMVALNNRFPFRDPEWWTKVAFPAFRRKQTVLWKPGDPTNRN